MAGAVVVVPASLALGALGTATSASGSFSATVLHSFTGAMGTHGEALTKPDDITLMSGDIFAAFQNGVGSQGEPSSTGNIYSTIVELSPSAGLLNQWDVVGKVDGLSADPSLGKLIATVNEDGNSSLYTVDPSASVITHYAYSPSSLPHGGGTDAISLYEGQILISASAPSKPNGPALYSATLSYPTATLTSLFRDEAKATTANAGVAYGTQVRLALTDPDSNEVVPSYSPRFGSDFALDSQGDQQLIFTGDPRGNNPSLWVLNLSQSINDTAWAPSSGATLYVTDPAQDSIDAVTGSFSAGEPIVAVTPCDANSAPATCTTPNYLGNLDLSTGVITKVTLSSGTVAPAGLVFSS